MTQTSDITVRMSALAKNCEMRDGHMEMPQDLRAAMGFKLDLRRQKTKTKYDGVYQVRAFLSIIVALMAPDSMQCSKIVIH